MIDKAMRRILILTKNILSEMSFQEKLQKLNFEVYCSSYLLNRLLLNGDIKESVKDFDLVVVSELVADSELIQFSPRLSALKLPVFRKMDSPLLMEEEDYLSRLNLEGYIQESMNKEELRELINSVSVKEAVPNDKYTLPLTGKYKTTITNLPLSNMEKEFLRTLYETEGGYLSREEASKAIWGKCDRSTLSRLSMMKKSIENKLSRTNLPMPLFTTVWGKGYQTKESFYKYLVN